MKLFKFIIPLFSFIFIFISCKSDDDNTSPNELNITEENTLFEGHWYSIYLDNEVDEVEVEIDSLQAIIDDQGTQTEQSTLDAYDSANTRRAELKLELAAQNNINTDLSISNLAIGKVFPPLPPCLCAPVGTDYYIVNDAVKKLKITFIDANEELIGSFNSLSPIPDSAGGLQYSSVNLFGYVGLMTMQVEKEDSNGQTISYEINNIAVVANNTNTQ